MDDAGARQLVARVEGLLGEVEDDPAAVEAVTALVELYGEGLRRLLAGADPAADELVSHLLVAHGLHPDPIEQRVGQALDEVRPYLRSHGGGVELLAIDDGVVRLRLEGTCNGCPSSTATMKLAIEEAVQRAAPEVHRVEAEGAAAQAPSLVQMRRFGERGNEDPGWRVAGAVTEVQGGGSALRTVGGSPVLFLGIDGELYAYRPTCPACGGSLADGRLSGGELECAGCARRFDARRAGRCLDRPQLSLDPLPLLVAEGGLVKVALA
ncbi:MAG: NifU family protein [Gaiellales bacterium]